jgi:hypothetical protein
MSQAAERRRGANPRGSSSRTEVKSSRADRAGRPLDPRAMADPKRAVLLLEARRYSLTADSSLFRRRIRRYEDLLLAATVTRLERDFLDSASDLQWADSAAKRSLSTAINLDLKRQSRDLQRFGRRLSSEARKRAEVTAAKRFDAIAAGVATELSRPNRTPGVAPAAGRTVRQRATAAHRLGGSEPRLSSRPAPRDPHRTPIRPAVAFGLALERLRRALALAKPRRAPIAFGGVWTAVFRRPRLWARIRPRIAGARAHPGRVATVSVALAAVTLAALLGVTGLPFGGPSGKQGSAYGSSDFGAFRAGLGASQRAAMSARRGIKLESRAPAAAHRHGARHATRGSGGRGPSGPSGHHTLAASRGGGGGAAAPSSGGGNADASGPAPPAPVAPSQPPAVPSPPPAPSLPSVPNPPSNPVPSHPVTHTVHTVDNAAHNAGANTGVSHATRGVTRTVDGAVGGATGGLLGH